MLGLPAGELTLSAQLNISRPRTILRGEGAAATTLHLTRSLTDLKGPSGYSEGFWVYSGGLLSVAPRPDAAIQQEVLTTVDASAPVPRGSYTLRVASAASLKQGDVVTLVMQGGNGTLSDEMWVEWRCGWSGRWVAGHHAADDLLPGGGVFVCPMHLCWDVCVPHAPLPLR